MAGTPLSYALRLEKEQPVSPSRGTVPPQPVTRGNNGNIVGQEIALSKN